MKVPSKKCPRCDTTVTVLYNFTRCPKCGWWTVNLNSAKVKA